MPSLIAFAFRLGGLTASGPDQSKVDVALFLRSRRTLAGTAMSGLSPGEGSGASKEVRMGRTPAQISASASALSSSLGGPVRILTDASTISIASITVAL